jgi:hypothetical protein
MTATTRTEWTLPKAELKELEFVTPPVCQGQIVEVSYAAHAEYSLFVRRTHDRSDDTTSYAAREWMDGEEADFWNGEPNGEFLPLRLTGVGYPVPYAK